MDQYVVYINGDATKEEFPYTVDGFVGALAQARETRKTTFRLDVVHVVNPYRVDLGWHASGLTDDEIDVAHAMGCEEYV